MGAPYYYLFVNGHYFKHLESWPDEAARVVGELDVAISVDSLPPRPGMPIIDRAPTARHSCEIDASLFDPLKPDDIRDISFRKGDGPLTAVEYLGMGNCQHRLISRSGHGQEAKCLIEFGFSEFRSDGQWLQKEVAHDRIL